MESAPSPTTTLAAPADSPADALLRWADRHRWWIFGGIALIYLAGFNGQWRIGPDTALFSTVGRSIAEGDGYVHPLGDQREVPPGLPWLIASCFRLFGVERFFPVHVVMWLMTLATLALFYHLIRLNAGRPAAVAITYMLAITERFYRYAFELMADLPFLFGLMLFLAGYEATWHGVGRDTGAENPGGQFRRAWPWIAMPAGVVIMALFRSVVLVFAAGLALAALWHLIRRQHAWRHALILLLTLGSIVFARWLDPRVSNPFQPTNDELIAQETLATDVRELLGRIATHNLPEMFEGAAPEALFGIELGPVLNTAVALVVFGLSISLAAHRVLWAWLVAAFIGQMIVFYFVVPRYFLPILPLLIAAGWFGANRLNHAVRQPLGGWLAIALTFAWTVPNIVKVGANIIEQRRPDYYAHYEDGEYRNIAEFGRQVREKTEPNAWLVIRDGRWRQQLTYFTRRKVINLQRFNEIALERPGEFFYYVEQGLRKFPRRVINRRQWRFSEPLAIVERAADLDPWTLRKVTYNPTTRPTRERPATRAR